MKHFLIIITMIAFIMIACAENKVPDNNSQQEETAVQNDHKVKVIEVEQANEYSYLKVDENGEEYWMAVRKGEFEVGTTYYYDSGMEMQNFTSRDLDKTFDKVLFVENISSQPISQLNSGLNAQASMPRPVSSRESISIEPVDGGISIAELYTNKDKYADKVVTLKGQVTKYNANIMGKNWIHIQDGTSSDENFDITLTTTGTAEVGDIIVCKGKVVLDKDFGAGYSYSIIIEEAIISN